MNILIIDVTVFYYLWDTMNLTNKQNFDKWWADNIRPLQSHINNSHSILIPIVLFVLWILSGFYIVQPDEQGVVTRFGKWIYTTQSGLHYHLPMPIDSVEKVKVTRVNRMDIGFDNYLIHAGEIQINDNLKESLMLTGDENIVNLNFSIFWIVNDAGLFLFQLDNPMVTIKALAESAMREIIGKNKLQYALTDGRKEIENAVQQIMQDSLDEYKSGVKITEVKLQKVDPPKEVIASFRDVQAAEADRIRSQNEAQAYANDIIPRARGKSEIIIKKSEGYYYDKVQKASADAERFKAILKEYKTAPMLTKKRLYMETMTKILSENKNTIIFNTTDKVLPYLDVLKKPLPSKEAE